MGRNLKYGFKFDEDQYINDMNEFVGYRNNPRAIIYDAMGDDIEDVVPQRREYNLQYDIERTLSLMDRLTYTEATPIATFSSWIFFQPPLLRFR